jgi:hypothetical protein
MEHEKTSYQSPEILVFSLSMEEELLNTSNNGEMGNGGFLDE